MIVDYFIIRKKQLIVDDLYSHHGIYQYSSGFNSVAIIAFVLGVFPNVPGFLNAIHIVKNDLFPMWLTNLYNYSWFVGFAIAAIVYAAFSKIDKKSN